MTFFNFLMELLGNKLIKLKGVWFASCCINNNIPCVIIMNIFSGNYTDTMLSCFLTNRQKNCCFLLLSCIRKMNKYISLVDALLCASASYNADTSAPSNVLTSKVIISRKRTRQKSICLIPNYRQIWPSPLSACLARPLRSRNLYAKIIKTWSFDH